MAHFAKISPAGYVIDIMVVDNAILKDEQGNEIEDKAIEWLDTYFGGDHFWRQTSYNTKCGVHYRSDNTPSEDQSKAFRVNYAVIGGTYDRVRDMFVAKRNDFDTNGIHVLNESTGQWKFFRYQINTPNDQTRELPENILEYQNWQWDPVKWTWYIKQ